MRILLTGGTGFIGRELTLALAARQHDVVLVSRSAGGGARRLEHGESSDQREPLRSVAWNVADGVEREVEQANAVAHLAGESVAGGRWTAARLDRIRSSRVDTTARLAQAIARSRAKPRVFVSASAVGYYGARSDDRALDERAPSGDDVLARICVEWEGAAAPAEATTRVVHPRFGIVLGRGGGALASMVTPFRCFVGGPLGSGTQWMSWVHLHDAVNALLFAIDNEALVGPFNVTAPAPVDMNAFAKALGDALHRPSAMRVPAAALRLAVGRGLATALLSGQRALPRALLGLAFAFRFPSLAGALSDVLSPR
jgi:uncharacterized protein (TIGR01777 family)